MGPTIMLDKSALQSFSKDEMMTLYRYYFLNIPPVLVIEVLADLKKDTRNRKLSEKEVQKLAAKIVFLNCCINVHYHDLLVSDLFGRSFIMDGRPIMGGGKQVKDSEGQVGIVFDKTAESETIIKWGQGIFSDTEEQLAESWRMSIQAFNIGVFKNETKKIFCSYVKLSNLEDVLAFIDELLQNEKNQASFLDLILRDIKLDTNKRGIIYDRWLSGKYHNIKTFAPYAYHYLRVQITFYFALMNDLIGTKSTNRIDLEYLLYLPFTLIFSSADKFHIKMSKLFLNDKQDFVEANHLKMDLNNINSYLRSLPKFEQKPMYGSPPPEIPHSFTTKMWRKYKRG